MPEPSLLILIPAYNEETRIEPVLREYADFFGKNYAGKFQIVVVLNGCRDNTLGVVQKVGAEFPAVSALEFKEAIGKGGALIEGLKLAMHADLIGYVDADGATPPHSIFSLTKYIAQADCVIGSRWLPDSVLHQEQTTLRKSFSRCFHFIVEMLFWLHIKDTQCPCKLIRREAVEKIHSNLRIADLELNRLTQQVRRDGHRIDLTVKEYSVLEYLMHSPGRVFSRTMILNHVWDQSFEAVTNIVDVYVRYLRRKVDEPFPNKLIHTVRGVGYCMREAEPERHAAPE